ncbi:putative leucine-rich repeat-containing protein 20 [Triplophysa rosa]|uniref:Leucine-rich repeat-containing protein 20 n=1 Tax=Triplophysa rosa TaxID=992332 RepID=A0A9W7TGC6_TRIRA|nr:putative leucine-rich repeat-containing protein 20 [Triplophysa rosa]
MAQAVANVARRINETMEEGRDCLDLSDCDLISFPDGIFKMLRSCTDNIHKITLANNQLKALGNKFFHTFSQLQDLDVQGNVLTSLPDAVGDVEHLISINLSKNRLAVFPERLTRVKSLQNINVEGNQITGDTSRNLFYRHQTFCPHVLALVGNIQEGFVSFVLSTSSRIYFESDQQHLYICVAHTHPP